MDDLPKEGGEGDKKIVHTYALVKVKTVHFTRTLPLSCSIHFKMHRASPFSITQLCDIKIIEKSQRQTAGGIDGSKDRGYRWIGRRGNRKRDGGREGERLACVMTLSDRISRSPSHKLIL
jgi:hypothetical protein